jgi:Endonuclease/Exonuclease/phosphatase family
VRYSAASRARRSVSCARAEPNESTTFVTELRIGTWNVQYARGVAKNRARLELLDSYNAHVWVLTETHDDLDLSHSHNRVHSEHRYPTPGGRWTTIWTSLPVIERLPTGDARRCVATRLDAGMAGEVVVYGTVLPWNGDAGPDATQPARGWDEFHRVVPEQGREWATLRNRYPGATLIVAGDLNQDLGGRHYYGTKACRALLASQLANANLSCLTTTDRFDPGLLQHPPIDHICAAPGRDRSLTSKAHGWNNVVHDVKLSDHGGTLVSLKIDPCSTLLGNPLNG